jgi:hypothetical protein
LFWHGRHKAFLSEHRCKVKSHASKKFKMGCNAGWFLASKSQPLTGTLTAFITPFLDASKITEDTREVLTNTLDHKTTKEWEEFIAEANEEWEEVQAQCPLEGLEEQLSGALGDEDSATAEGDLELLCTPNEFVWREDLKPEPIKLKAKDLAIPKTSTLEEDVEDLQAAFKDLSRMVVDAMQGLQDDAMEVLE